MANNRLYDDGYIYGTAPKPQEWISVEDRLPEISPAYATSECVLVRAQCLCHVADLGDDGKWRDIHSSDELIDVTHWQPLPSPPDDKEGT